MMGTRSTRMRWAAMAMACRPEEQKRLTVAPDVVTGSPPRRAAWRAMFCPVAPSGSVQPRSTSSPSPGSSPARVPAQRRAVGVVERATIGPADRGPRSRDDDGVRHDGSPCVYRPLTGASAWVSGPQPGAPGKRRRIEERVAIHVAQRGENGLRHARMPRAEPREEIPDLAAHARLLAADPRDGLKP